MPCDILSRLNECDSHEDDMEYGADDYGGTYMYGDMDSFDDFDEYDDWYDDESVEELIVPILYDNS